jgi:uroporphyrinogen decarboxylase
MLKEFVEKTGVDAISIDNSVPLEWAFENLNCVIQGNLDQITLLADKSVIKTEAEKILKAAQGKKFIFNLGHGIVQQTPEENVAYLCDVIRG